jgi:hypothetical protein
LFLSDTRASGRTDRQTLRNYSRLCNFSNAYKNLFKKYYACKYLQLRSIQNIFEPPSPSNVIRAVTGARILRSFVIYRVMLAS